MHLTLIKKNMFRFEILAIICFLSFDIGHCTERLECPPPQDIHPCVCRSFPNVAVTCDGMPNLASVRNALEGHFTQFPRLKLTNIHSYSLPSYALGDLSPRKLYLEDSNLRNIADDAFEGQENLGLLVLADDRLQEIPTEPLKRLTSLHSLSLGGNFLMRINEDSLSDLTSLNSLVISDNRISEIDKNSFPRNLVSLLLSRNILSTFNNSLLLLKHLEDLWAADNRITTIQGEFEGLNNLQYLYLDRNHISDISDGLQSLTSLTALSLSGNRISDIGSTFSNLKKLRILNISHNYITESNAKSFEKLQALEILDLSGNYMKAVCSTLKPLRALRELRLADIHLRQLGPHCFQNMKNLKLLDLSHNQLTDVDPVFEYPLPSLAYLHLGHNKLTALTYGMRSAKNLRELDISFNHFRLFKAQHLGHNRELEKLKVEGNPWKCNHLLKTMFDNLEHHNVDVQGRPDC